MIWILVAVIAIIVGIYLIDRSKKDEGINIFTIMAVTTAALIIYIGGNTITAECVPAQYTVGEECQLAFLHNDTSVEGSFFLGSGTIKEEQYLFYCRELDGGGWQLDKAKTDSSIIHEEARDNGKLIIYIPTLKSRIWSSFYDDTYRFYIPENSIVRNFTVK